MANLFKNIIINMMHHLFSPDVRILFKESALRRFGFSVLEILILDMKTQYLSAYKELSLVGWS